MKNLKDDSFSAAKRNAVILLIWNMASTGIPLIEIPFLSRALGVENYGSLLFIQSLVMTASVFIDYGFHYSGARKIAYTLNDNKAKAQTVSNILTAKIMLYFVIILAILPIYWITSDEKFPERYIVICLLLAASGFSPVWYFLGKGNLSIPAIADIALRLIGLLLIISLVHASKDLMLVLFIQCSISLLTSLLSSISMFKETGLVKPNLNMIVQEFRTGWSFFIFKGATNLSSSIATTILGLASTSYQIGLFSPSEKLIRAATTCFTMILSAFFPYSVQNIIKDGDAFKIHLKKFIIILFFALFIVSSTIALVSKPLVQIVFGNQFVFAATFLQILVFLIPFRVTSAVISILWLIPAGHENISSRLSLANIIFIFTLGILIAPSSGALGVAAVLATGEITLFLALMYFTWKLPPPRPCPTKKQSQ